MLAALEPWACVSRWIFGAGGGALSKEPAKAGRRKNNRALRAAWDGWARREKRTGGRGACLGGASPGRSLRPRRRAAVGLHRSTATSAGREPLGKLLPEATCGISSCQLRGDEIRNPLRQQELRCWLPGCRLVVGLSWHRGGWGLRATSVWGDQVGFCCFWHFLPHYVHTSESESGSSCGGNAEQREPRTELRSFEGWQRGSGCAVVGSGWVAELGGVGASGGCGATGELRGAI